jgi:hypothetical protein
MRWVGFEVGNVYRILVGYLGTDGRIILKYVLRK